ncbi:NAD-dependent epimerase/dehydratase family protein [Catenulispora pinisilvae]|uniref:NAD-dependent epimerase/dehydratase family protein n=1 Tax=Catenulispora pinisilvae TaxID=2705253 RepID=UPI001890E7D4|nr:NmrA family NAD(P)-binding protein [Catenulispora pinisilvae]
MTATTTLADIARRVHEPDERLILELAKTEGDLVVLGAAGKMGVSLARMAAAAFDRLPGGRTVHAVSRFSDSSARAELDQAGVHTVSADLGDDSALAGLPDAPNVVYMVGRKFGTTGDAAPTWATNVYLPGRVAQRYAGARISAFSSGNVYPLLPPTSGGADENVAPDPVGEYAQSCLGRERILAYQAAATGSPLAIIRLNYAIDCRYGVLTDIARAVLSGNPVDLGNGLVNVIWQGDANRYALSALAHADSSGKEPLVLNVTGPETASVRWLATELGRRLDREPVFAGTESPTALLSNAARCFGLFGYPEVSLHQMLDWTVVWLQEGGALLDKPTHFTERAGRF